jgi:hypothetical protein
VVAFVDEPLLFSANRLLRIGAYLLIDVEEPFRESESLPGAALLHLSRPVGDYRVCHPFRSAKRERERPPTAEAA